MARRLTNDTLVRQIRERRELSIMTCSTWAALAITKRLPKRIAQRVDTEVLAELIAREFRQGLR